MMLLHRAREGRIFVVLTSLQYLAKDFRTRRKWVSPSTTIWSTHSRRIDPAIFRQSRSAKANLARHGWIGGYLSGPDRTIQLISPSSRRLS
jgi:hypothetical protein